MSNFIYPQLRLPNIPQQRFPAKINLLKKDVYLQFLLANDVGKTLKVVFLININTTQQQRDPSFILKSSMIDKNSFKRSIMANISAFDKRFMTLQSFDTMRAIFTLDTTSYLRAAASTVKPLTRIEAFKREFQLKERVPDMIKMDPMGGVWDNFIVRKFKEYMEESRKEIAWFKTLIPDVARRKMRMKIRTMFDWTYDYTTNKVIATMKPIYALAVIYAVGAMTKRLTKNDFFSINRQDVFAKKVTGNIKRFDSIRYDKYVKKKGFF